MNLEFDSIFPSYSSYIVILFLLLMSVQICTRYPDDSIIFMRLEELKLPTVVRVTLNET